MCGYLNSRTKVPDRGVFGFLRALLVDARNAATLIEALSRKEYPGNDWLPRVPETYYTFAGEIPWSPEFARDVEEDEGTLYREKIETTSGAPIEVEILAHDFGWESYHSALNQAGGAYVPSWSFSHAFDLRGTPQSFDQVQPNGAKATISLTAPAGFTGHLLYLREDLVKEYLGSRKLVWFIWGERNVYSHIHSPPPWLVRAHQQHAIIWRRLVRGEDLSRALSSKRSRDAKSRRNTKAH